MDAWLSSADTDETEASSQQSAVGKEQSGSENNMQSPHAESFREPKAESQFISLPETIPISLRIKLAAFIKTMTMQQLRGATDFRQGFLEAQIQKVYNASHVRYLRYRDKACHRRNPIAKEQRTFEFSNANVRWDVHRRAIRYRTNFNPPLSNTLKRFKNNKRRLSINSL